MDYGSIIKRAWQVTWRYRILWVLGIFAGVTGPAGGGGGSGNSGGGSSGSSGSNGSMPELPSPDAVLQRASEYLPMVIAVGVVVVVLGLVLWALGVAARGGLINGVNAIEDGSARPLGVLWADGFARFWSLVGLYVLVGLPILVVSLLMLGFVGVPFMAAYISGGDPGVEVLGPMCGSLLIGIPLLFVGGIVLGFIRIIGERYIMLGGQGAIESAKNGWKFLRSRIKDGLIMYLISFGLTVAASLVLAIPMIAIIAVAVVPGVIAGTAGNWGALTGIIAVALVLFAVASMAFNGVWGTFTSSLWTLFFRDATAAPVAVVPAAAGVVPTDGATA